MLGFIIGTVCLIGLIKVIRGRRHGWAQMHGYGYGGGCGSNYGGGCGGRGYGWGGPRWGGGYRDSYGGHDHQHGHDHDHGPGPWGGGGFFLRGLFQRLDTTPGQEKVIKSAFEQVKKTMQEARSEWRDGNEVADLFRGESFDRTAAEGVSGKADASFAKVRVAIVEALAQIHEVLDERQRGMIADFLARNGGRGFFRGVRGERSAWV